MVRPLKVLQFNMQFGQTWDEENPDHAPVDLDLTLEALRAVEADVIFLQEVEHVENPGFPAHPPPNYTRLRNALDGYESVFAYPPPHKNELPFGYGLAVFSRTPLWNAREVVLPSAGITFDFFGTTTSPTDRLLISVCTKIEGRTVRLVNTHLQAYFMIGSSSDEHPQQRDTVVSVLKESGLPTLLGGDFNCAPDDGSLRTFTDAGYHTVQENEITWRRRNYVTDHILYSPEWTVESWRVQPTRASDHHLLIAEMRLM